MYYLIFLLFVNFFLILKLIKSIVFIEIYKLIQFVKIVTSCLTNKIAFYICCVKTQEMKKNTNMICCMMCPLQVGVIGCIC